MGFGFWVLGFGFWVLGFGFWVGSWVLGLFGVWVYLGFGVWGLGFRAGSLACGPCASSPHMALSNRASSLLLVVVLSPCR